MNEEKIKICCSWNSKNKCIDCKIEEQLNCRYDRKKWLFFIINQIPTRLFAIFGLIITGLLYYWWPLIVFGSVVAFFTIFGIETRIVCTHCPFYSSNSKTLRCYALTGSRKIWKYRPGPMKIWEKIVISTHFLFLLLWPIGFEAYLVWKVAINYSFYGLYSLLGMIILLSATTLAGAQFSYILKVVFCSKCINFSCPMNNVSKTVVDDYLSKNEIMKEAWKKAGYKIENEQEKIRL